MEIGEVRRYGRTAMTVGSAAALIGIAIMVHGEMNFGDAVLVGGLVMLAIGAFVLGKTPMGGKQCRLTGKVAR